MQHMIYEYYVSNVPLFRRNGYRQSGAMIPWVRNRDTTFATCEFTRLMPDPSRILHAWIYNSSGPSGWCWSCTRHAWCDPGSLPRGDRHRRPVDRTSHCNHTESKRWWMTFCVSDGEVHINCAIVKTQDAFAKCKTLFDFLRISYYNWRK